MKTSSPRRNESGEPLNAYDTPLVIATSAGGPDALQELISSLPAHLPIGGVIVQHMGPQFTAMLAERLDQVGHYHVREARQGDVLYRETFLIAPGGHHLRFDNIGRARLDPGPPINTVRPCADVTMQAMAQIYRARLLGLVLTGSGQDGLAGAEKIRHYGGTIFAQDEASCFIASMPHGVIKAGLATIVARPNMLSLGIASFANRKLSKSLER